MIWNILMWVTIGFTALLVLLFIPCLVFVVSDAILGFDLDGKVEKRFPKVYDIWPRCILADLIILVCLLIPVGIHADAEESREETIVLSVDDEIRVTMESGKTYVIQVEDVVD